MWGLKLNNLMEYWKCFVVKQVREYLVMCYWKVLRGLMSVIEVY